MINVTPGSVHTVLQKLRAYAPLLPVLASHWLGRDTTSMPQINKEIPVKIMPPVSPPVR